MYNHVSGGTLSGTLFLKNSYEVDNDLTKSRSKYRDRFHGCLYMVQLYQHVREFLFSDCKIDETVSKLSEIRI